MDDKTAVGSALHFLRKPLFLAMASGWVALTGHQPALASTSLTSEAIFNFDFTTQPVDQPPYFGVFLQADLGGSTGPLTIEFFNDLDGNGGAATSPFTFTFAPVNYIDFFSTIAPGVINDGIFSVGLQSNTLSLNSIFARGCTKSPCGPGFETPNIPGTLSIVGNVPEPATLALLGIAVAGLAARRRKPRS